MIYAKGNSVKMEGNGKEVIIELSGVIISAMDQFGEDFVEDLVGVLRKEKGNVIADGTQVILNPDELKRQMEENGDG